MSKLHFTCPEKHFETSFLKKSYNFIILFGLLAKNFGIAAKTTSPEENILRRNKNFELCFHYYFRTLSGNFLEFWENTSARIVKTAFHVSRGTFEENFFFWNKLFHIQFLDFEQKNFELLVKILAGLSKLHSACPNEHFWVFKTFPKSEQICQHRLRALTLS